MLLKYRDYFVIIPNFFTKIQAGHRYILLLLHLHDYYDLHHLSTYLDSQTTLVHSQILLSNLTQKKLSVYIHTSAANEEDDERRSRRGVGTCDSGEMGWIMLRIDYSRLSWLLFRVFSYENHDGKPGFFFF
ncbi:hypothetical protein OWV82_010823 [Melia azedarach]|uniref:Uncharacterized protein n=1 Tax=Melia azedarach TaxID=155640 RepID=A0ACC1Y6A3_MELAZ|nr:hypothetical protein OWV82_010823 [Melia azedarach]